jgi:hypothetical protein
MDQKQTPHEGGAGDRLAAGHGPDSNPTSTAAQQQRILDALRLRPHTSYELRRMGCYQCPARIFELRGQGHNISTARVTVVDSDGYSHVGAALYTLERK